MPFAGRRTVDAPEQAPNDPHPSPPSAAATVVLRDLGYRLPNGQNLITGISLTARPGEILGVIGPNGAGKTTLLRCLYGALRPTTGQAWIGDTDLRTLSDRARARRLAAVPQETVVQIPLTVREVVETGRFAHVDRWFNRDTGGRDVVDHALAVTQLSALLVRDYPTLSGGERRRTLIARALAQDPEVLVLDEPTNHLDPRHQLDLLALLRRLSLTTIVTLHDLDLAARFCDQIAVLADGRLVASGPPATVFTPALMAEVFQVDGRVRTDERDGSLRLTTDLLPTNPSSSSESDRSDTSVIPLGHRSPP